VRIARRKRRSKNRFMELVCWQLEFVRCCDCGGHIVAGSATSRAKRPKTNFGKCTTARATNVAAGR
jgi:hypothetical protein